MYEKLYSNITDGLVTDGYAIVKNALPSELSTQLLNFAQEEKGFKRAGISDSSNLRLDSNRRRDKIYWLREDASLFSGFFNFTNGLQEYLNRELFLGLSYYESHLALYNTGDFYEKHVDAFKNSKNRVVTTVFYLNEEWRESDGGELVVYDEDDKFITKVIPDKNTLVVFLSEKFPHEVLSAKKKRFSVAGWFRVDKRI